MCVQQGGRDRDRKTDYNLGSFGDLGQYPREIPYHLPPGSTAGEQGKVPTVMVKVKESLNICHQCGC